ncbi:MAG: class I SAM-dependent methyltransferase [Phycisphaerae bacterium]|jgi:SAM-dependent methyltransferase
MILLNAPLVCPVCSAAPRRTIRLPNGEDLLRCPRCGLGWWPWPAFDPGAFYDRDYFQSESSAKGYCDYASMEAGVRRTATTRLRRIARLAAAPRGAARRLFEIGCGTGVFLDEARRAGWQAEGLEVSRFAADVARGRGLPVTCAPAEHCGIEVGAYDCVALWDVVEHLRDPVRTLRTAAAGLRPGGVLALSTGDLSSLCARLSGCHWHLYNLPEHLYFFTPLALRRTIAQAGCRVCRVVREINWCPLRYIVERLEKKLLGRLPLGALRRARLVVPATLLDVVGVYATRSPERPG